MEKNNLKPLIVIIFVNFLWGIDFIAIEYMMRFMSPSVFTLCRLGIGALILLAASFLLRGGLHIQRQDMLRILIAGGIGMSLYFTVESLGTGLTSASFSSLITPMGILVTVATSIVCIIIGQFGYVFAIGHLSPTVVSAFENVLPVTTVVLSIFIFGKILTGLQIIGAILIMVSVTVIALKSE